jgi:hypothetical protein
MVVGIMGTAVQTAATLTVGTSRYTQSGTTNFESGFIADAAGAATITMGFTGGATALWGAVACNLNPPLVVAFDSLGGGIPNGSHTGAGALTYTHNIASATDEVVIVGFELSGGGANPWSFYAPTAVTFGGQSMLPVVNEMGNAAVANATGFVALYYLHNPPVGVNTVSITAPVTGDWWANSVSYTGASAVKTAVTASGTSTTISTGAIPSAVKHRVVSVLGAVHTISTPSQTPRFSGASTSSFQSGYIQDAAGAATVTTTMTSGVSTAYAAATLDLYEAHAAPLSGHGVLSAVIHPKPTLTAPLKGTGVLTATLKPAFTEPLSGHGVLSVKVALGSALPPSSQVAVPLPSWPFRVPLSQAFSPATGF